MPNDRRGDRPRDQDRRDDDRNDSRTPDAVAGDLSGGSADPATNQPDPDLDDPDLDDPDIADSEVAGSEVADSDNADSDNADLAAASALARVRESARAKGLRPGSRPMGAGRRAGQSGVPAGGSRQGPDGRDRDDGRDPTLLGDQMERLLLDRGWNVDVAVGSVMGRWPAIVGVEVAAHCIPVTFGDGVLTVRADSTAWAAELRLMSSSILGRLESEVGKDAVTELRVQGPSAPSWTRGPRKSIGRGPRDTYG